MLKLYTLSYILIGLCIIISVISEDEQKVVQLSDHDVSIVVATIYLLNKNIIF